MAPNHIRLPLYGFSFFPLEGQAFSYLCEMHGRAGRHHNMLPASLFPDNSCMAVCCNAFPNDNRWWSAGGNEI